MAVPTTEQKPEDGKADVSEKPLPPTSTDNSLAEGNVEVSVEGQFYSFTVCKEGVIWNCLDYNP
jgi:hypothetical protein